MIAARSQASIAIKILSRDLTLSVFILVVLLVRIKPTTQARFMQEIIYLVELLKCRKPVETGLR